MSKGYMKTAGPGRPEYSGTKSSSSTTSKSNSSMNSGCCGTKLVSPDLSGTAQLPATPASPIAQRKHLGGIS